MSKEELFRIKPLVWKKCGPRQYRCSTIIGSFILDRHCGVWLLNVFDAGILVHNDGYFASLVEAKAAAEAFYRERLMKALEKTE